MESSIYTIQSDDILHIVSFCVFLFVYRKFILIMLATCSPIPAGVLTPAFILGSVFGRLYGLIVKNIGLTIGISLVKCNNIIRLI